MEEQIYQDYLNGRYKSQTEIHRVCKGDCLLLGRVMVKIQAHKKALEALKVINPLVQQKYSYGWLWTAFENCLGRLWLKLKRN